MHRTGKLWWAVTRLSLAVVVAILSGAGAISAQAAETSIYVAKGPGYSLLLRAEGGHVFAVSLSHKVYCEYRGEGGVQTQEIVNVDFSREPKEFDRAGAHIYLDQHESNPFEDHRLVIDGDIHYTAIVGYFSSSASGEGLGGVCRSGGFTGSSRVTFEAVRYARYDSGPVIGTGPDRSPERLYFAHDDRVEAYFWADEDSVNEILGSSKRRCSSRGRGEYESRGEYDLLAPPFALSTPGGQFQAHATSPNYPRETVRIFGAVDEVALIGGVRERVVETRQGRSNLLCWIGRRRGSGYRHFHAVRYVQVPPIESSQTER